MTSCRIATIPSELSWENPPTAWKIDPEQRLTIVSGKRTDLFTDPQGTVTLRNAPQALFRPENGDFLLSARVEVDFASTFDAGVLILYQDPEHWAKLCFEFSPQRQPMIVSVVNRGVSDDCNSVPIAGREVSLRSARIKNTFAFHYSTDGQVWQMVRYFSLGCDLDRLAIGFSSQSPTGEGCTATFSDITYEHRTLPDIRNGE